ncbi:MAG: MarR family transcriptional regulator [Lachnospiraceae bacterium]|nr:MarR family transcriptional regulator [Lachnospiraceae bacterium]
MSSFEIVNDVLANLFQEILVLEERGIITGEFTNITVNDMHIIDKIGPGEGKNMSAIAKEHGVTVGSLTTSMNSLVKKEYVIRERSEQDRRVVTIRLSEKGLRAYEQHKEFHMKMTAAALATLKEEEIPKVTKVLVGLEKFFREYEV